MIKRIISIFLPWRNLHNGTMQKVIKVSEEAEAATSRAHATILSYRMADMAIGRRNR